MESRQLFEKLHGRWQGTCRTWFQPGELADESAVTGSFEPVFDGCFLRHTYRSTIKEQDRHGEELFAFNTVTRQYQVTWVDDFHMNDAIMVSTGEATPAGCSVFGKYEVAPDQPPWGWKTDYQLVADHQLTITAYNVSPAGEEAKAVETVYQRVAEP